MKQAILNSANVKVVTYAPGIRDIRVVGDVAYEWGYFEAEKNGSDQKALQRLRAKLLRVMKRQSDGSWKFTRVMWLPD
jgi:ketosteroid isomerase-like protein